jgi:hypothetical protein
MAVEAHMALRIVTRMPTLTMAGIGTITETVEYRLGQAIILVHHDVLLGKAKATEIMASRMGRQLHVLHSLRLLVKVLDIHCQ